MTLVTRPAMTDDTGTGQDGTIVDESLIDDVLDQIDDQNHSTTNPTVKPKAVTDEVVAARGSKASLDARLDVSLEEDGTLKEQASLVTQALASSFVVARDVALNGALDDWTAGDSAAPDNFVLSAGTIVKCGDGQADTTAFGTGLYTAKLTRAGTNVNLTQTVIATADMAANAQVKGRNFAAVCRGLTSIASHLRLTVSDGVTTTSSDYHTGGGTEEELSVVHAISASATKLEFYAEVVSSNGDAYVGGFTAAFSDVAPSDWTPLSVIPPANATRGGLVSAIEQSIPAQKNFVVTPKFKLGSSAGFVGTANSRFYTDTTQKQNGTTVETDLHSTTLLGNTLDVDGKAVTFRTVGNLATGNTKVVKFYLGSDAITLYNSNGTGVVWWEVTVIRTGAATQKVIACGGAMNGGVNIASFTRTLSSDNTAKFTCTGGATGDCIMEAMIATAEGC